METNEFGNKKINSNNLRQINAYLDNATIEDGQKLDGMLLHPTIDEEYDEVFKYQDLRMPRINLEDRIDEGDAVIFYGSIAHGVEAIDPHKKLSWNSNEGRWFLGMFVNDSDHVKNRVTSKDLTGIIKTNFNN